MRFDIIVRPGPDGRFIALVPSVPEVRAEGATDIEAVQHAHRLLLSWLTSARVVSVEVPDLPAMNSMILWAGHAQTDAEFEEYQEDIRRFKQEVDERECPNSSSTPIT